MHENGYVHRDLKMQNIMVTRNKDGFITFKVGDFGLCKKLKEDEPETLVAGSPHIMAPELIQGGPYGLAVDIWSIGVIMYELANNKLPFTSKLDIISK